MGNSICLPNCKDKNQLTQLSNNVKFSIVNCKIEEWRQYGFPLYYIKEESMMKEDIQLVQSIYQSFAEKNYISGDWRQNNNQTSLKIHEEKNFISKKYYIKVYFPFYQFSLQNFLDENKTTCPLPSEILLLNIISNVIVALIQCEKEQVPHLNISPDSIFLEQQGFWRLQSPAPWRTTLKIETETNQKQYAYLIPKGIQQINDYRQLLKNDQWIKNDIYSLGILIMQCTIPYNQSQKKSILSEEQIQNKLIVLKRYYSQQFIELIQNMTQTNEQLRMNCDQVIDFINKIKFC